MIIFFDNKLSARNSLYPLILPGKNSTVLGYDVTHYLRDVPFFLIWNSVIVLLLSGAMSFIESGIGEFLYCTAVAGQVALVAVKLWRQRGMKVAVAVDNPSFGSKPAPMLAWVENLGMSANFVLIGKIGYGITTLPLAKFLSFYLVIFYVVMSVLPFINFIAWKFKNPK